jgi:hypothetical protein
MPSICLATDSAMSGQHAQLAQHRAHLVADLVVDQVRLEPSAH